MTDLKIEEIMTEFKIGDVVETNEGKIGIIVKIFIEDFYWGAGHFYAVAIEEKIELLYAKLLKPSTAQAAGKMEKLKADQTNGNI